MEEINDYKHMVSQSDFQKERIIEDFKEKLESLNNVNNRMINEQNIALKTQRQELSSEFEKSFHLKEFEWQREKDE